MDLGTRIGIAALGLAIVFGFMPFVVPQIPYWLGLSGMAIGLVVAGVGLWPWAASLSFGHLNWWRVPLWGALLICYEACEGTLSGEVASRQPTTRKKLGYFWSSFIVQGVRAFGEKPPSRKTRPISKDEMKDSVLCDEEGKSDLCRLGYREQGVIYRNVFIRRPDLWRHLRYLRKINGEQQVAAQR